MQNITSAVEKHRQLILEAGRYIWQNPETGYKEVKTSGYLAEQFEKLGYTLTYAEGIPGFYALIDTGRPGPTVLVLAELDAVLCPTHPESDPQTGAVHACGHNAQCAALLGVAAALKEPGVTDGLCGKIQLCAVPAEELLEIEYRSELVRQGKIKYLGGKSEFLHRGYFDGVDLAFMVHAAGRFCTLGGSIGCITKKIIYKGKAAHAGGAPWDGHNALYAANCGINAINALRETFIESDKIRVHPIITHGGDMVNAIPETVTLESYVRGATFQAIEAQNRKVNRALIGAALSLGTNIEIIDAPGYSPLINDPGMTEVCKEAAMQLMPAEEFAVSDEVWSASTDMGDLSCILPVVHPYAGGTCGTPHGNDYRVCDPEAACVMSAKWQVLMLRLLLQNDAACAKKILAKFQPAFASKAAFLAYQDGLNDAGDRIIYKEDSAEIRL